MERRINSRKAHHRRGENPKSQLPRRLTIITTICYCNDATHLNSLELYREATNLKLQIKINHLMYMNDIKLSA